MNVKTVIPLAVAIVLGLIAAMAAKNMIDKSKQHPTEVAHYTQVVVAKDNLAAGSQLKMEDMTTGKMAGDVPSDAVYGRPEELVGRVLKENLVRGQPVLEPMLASKGTGSGLQALVPDGMRAITIEVNDFSGVGGFLVPGCRVDVIATVTGDNNEMLARTVVQNVKVQAVNSHMQPAGPGEQPEPMKSITLVATPKEAEKIDLAASTGRPRFVLRASGDDAKPESDGVTAAELRGKVHHSDPFGDVKSVSMSHSSTQPSDWQPNHTRTISVIRAGVESQANVEIGMNDDKIFTGVNTEVQPADDRN